ncbi:16136_t:CDS:2, partial [Funneliformis mosseae]
TTQHHQAIKRRRKHQAVNSNAIKRQAVNSNRRNYGLSLRKMWGKGQAVAIGYIAHLPHDRAIFIRPKHKCLNITTQSLSAVIAAPEEVVQAAADGNPQKHSPTATAVFYYQESGKVLSMLTKKVYGSRPEKGKGGSYANERRQ